MRPPYLADDTGFPNLWIDDCDAAFGDNLRLTVMLTSKRDGA